MSSARWLNQPVSAESARQPQTWAANLWRGLLFCSLFSIIFAPEFGQGGAIEAGLSPYAKVGAGFRIVDLMIVMLVVAHIAALACLRDCAVRFPKILAWPGLAFLTCIAGAAVYGKMHGGSNFFFDWRGLALGIGLYFVWSFWLRDSSDVRAAILCFAAYGAVRIVILYVAFLIGKPETLMGVPIPVFDGPVLSCVVFTALLALGFRSNTADVRVRLLWGLLATAASLMVLLSFRRTYWGELGMGTMILLWLRREHRLRHFILLALTLAVAVVIMGGSFYTRLRSLDVSRDDSQFSADNADHLHDLEDAWDRVRQSPVMGIGLGMAYSTWQIRNWKAESVMVHNAPLHVWLKYGIAGLISYLWFHVALLRWLLRRSNAETSRHKAVLSIVFAYLAAQFVMTLSFAPWPYSELQRTVLMSFLVAAAVTTVQTDAAHPEL